MICDRCGNKDAYRIFSINHKDYCDKCGKKFILANMSHTRIYRPQTILGTGGKK